MFRRVKIIPIHLLVLLFLLLLTCALPTGYARESRTIAINSENEISVDIFAATGTHRNIIFIWQPHEQGLQTADTQLAEKLSSLGIEVWLLDLLEAYFMSNTASNMSQLNGDGFKTLISAATKTGKTVIVASSSRGNVAMLRGVRDWQRANQDHSRFAGAISLSPKLYTQTPSPGMPASLLPIAVASNLNYFIMQPDKSPSFWQLKQMITALEKSGSTVYLQPMKGIRDRFYFRPDAFDQEHKAGDALAEDLLNAIMLLTSTPPTYRQPALTLTRIENLTSKKQEPRLTKYRGNPVPNALNLPRFEGGTLDLKSLKGKVVLVNFWASWCPPCVHEMPSMERLNKIFNQQAFTLLGVNMAETKEEVQAFLTHKVNISFPIVMDYDGQTLQSWRVFAFPTSYVLDKQGKIRYALFGSVEWDNPDIVDKIKQLINE